MLATPRHGAAERIALAFDGMRLEKRRPPFMSHFLAPARTILRHRGFVVLLGCNLLLGLASSFVAPFLSMFGTIEVGMSPPVFGVFMTITSLSGVFLSTVLARWSDVRFTRRAMLVLGSFTGALGYVGYAFVRDVAGLIAIGSLMLGISSITFSQLFAHARELLVRSDVPPKDAPLYINVFRLLFSLAWTVGPALASAVMIRYSYRGTFLVAAFLFVLLLLSVLRFVPAVPPLAAAQRAAPVPFSELLLRPGLVAHFVGFVLIFVCTTMSIMNLPLLILDELGGNARHIGIVFSVAPVFELPFMYYCGLLASRGDQSRLIRMSVMLAIGYYALLAIVRAPWQIYPLQILSAAITAVIGGVAITFFQNFLPDHAGTATNLYSNAVRIGAMAGYLSFGVLAQSFGHRVVFVVCSSLCAIALSILFAFRPRENVPAPVLASGIS